MQADHLYAALTLLPGKTVTETLETGTRDEGEREEMGR